MACFKGNTYYRGIHTDLYKSVEFDINENETVETIKIVGSTRTIVNVEFHPENIVDDIIEQYLREDMTECTQELFDSI